MRSRSLTPLPAPVAPSKLERGLPKPVLKWAGGKARYLHHDVRDEAAWPGVIAEAEKHGALAG